MRNNQKLIAKHHISIQNTFIYVFIFSVILSISLNAQTPDSKHFKINQLTDGVYAAIHSIGGQAICNAGIVDLGDKTLIFDTFLSIKAAQDLQRISIELTSNPIYYLVNSHYHNDHIRGNQVFKPKANIISTILTRTAIAKNEPDQLKQEENYAPKRLVQLQKEIKSETDRIELQELNMWLGYYQALVESRPLQLITLPDITFEKRLTIYGNAKRVELIELCGHTKSDIIMYLPEDKIVFTGDLVFIGSHPYLADGNPHNLISSLNELKKMDIEKVVPGHGPVGNKDDIIMMIRYIEVIDSLSRELVLKGDSIDDVSNMPIPKPFDSWGFPNFFTTNIRFMYKISSKEINPNR